MNIKQLLEWRKRCYFCQGDLDIFPSVGGMEAEFSIGDGLFKIKGHQLSCQIDMESGQIYLPTLSSTNSIFLKATPLHFKIVCPYCNDGTPSPPQKYLYCGDVKNFGDGYVWVSSLKEFVCFGNLALRQKHILLKTSTILVKAKPFIDIAPINLDEMPPDKLKNKLKTYLTFS